MARNIISIFRQISIILDVSKDPKVIIDDINNTSKFNNNDVEEPKNGLRSKLKKRKIDG